MQYRNVDILAQETVADSGTKSIDLDVLDPITELAVTLDLKNGAAACVAHPPVDVVTKIEIVDGGTVYASLTGPEAVAMFCYQTGHYPAHWYSETLSENQSITIPLRFGRFLGDPLRSFDASRLRNPQLKITWAKNALHLTAYVKLAVRARIMDGVAGAASCLLPKAVRTFTTAASGIEPTELPTDYPIRALYVRSWLAGACPRGILTNFKLDCDEGKFIAFDITGENLQREIEDIYGYLEVRQNLQTSNAQKIQAWLGAAYGGYASIAGGSYTTQFWASGNPYGVIYGSDYNAAAFDDQKVELTSRGSLPHSTFAIPFGLPDDPATWFNAAAYRKVKLNLTQAESDCEASIVLQQDRPI